MIGKDLFLLCSSKMNIYSVIARRCSLACLHLPCTERRTVWRRHRRPATPARCPSGRAGFRRRVHGAQRSGSNLLVQSERAISAITRNTNPMIGKVFVPPSFLKNEWQSSSPNMPLTVKLHNDAHNDHPLVGSPRLKQKHAQTRACLIFLTGRVAVHTVSAGFEPAAEDLTPALTWQASPIRLSGTSSFDC